MPGAATRRIAIWSTLSSWAAEDEDDKHTQTQCALAFDSHSRIEFARFIHPQAEPLSHLLASRLTPLEDFRLLVPSGIATRQPFRVLWCIEGRSIIQPHPIIEWRVAMLDNCRTGELPCSPGRGEFNGADSSFPYTRELLV